MSNDNVSQSVLPYFKLVEVSRKVVVVREGRVPFYTEILPVLKGNSVTVSRVYESIIKAYGEDCISRMRVYKWLNSLVVKGLATKELSYDGDIYIVK